MKRTKKVLVSLLALATIGVSVVGLTACDFGSVVDSVMKNELSYTLSDDGTSYVVDGIGDIKAKKIVIPDTYKGLPVTSIGEDAFEYCSSLKSVTIGDGVTSIGDRVFAGCSSLTSVTIGNSVTSIGFGAFVGCNSLTEVYITDIGAWCNISFMERLFDEYSNPLMFGGDLYLNNKLVTKLVIPDGVTSIGTYAFRGCSSLTEVVIPDGVTSIGYYAFSGCSSLKSVTIGDSVTSIEFSAFYRCSSLTSITFEGTVAQWNAIEKDYWIDDVPVTKVICSDGVVTL